MLATRWYRLISVTIVSRYVAVPQIACSRPRSSSHAADSSPALMLWVVLKGMCDGWGHLLSVFNHAAHYPSGASKCYAPLPGKNNRKVGWKWEKIQDMTRLLLVCVFSLLHSVTCFSHAGKKRYSRLNTESTNFLAARLS